MNCYFCVLNGKPVEKAMIICVCRSYTMRTLELNTALLTEKHNKQS